MGEELKELCVDDTIYETALPEGRRVNGLKGMADPCEVRALIPGTIIDVKVHKGQHVEKGQVILILEAMKMFNEVSAEVGGRITEINVSEGDCVEKNQLMVRIGE